jgi:hypothetical protein
MALNSRRLIPLDGLDEILRFRIQTGFNHGWLIKCFAVYTSANGNTTEKTRHVFAETLRQKYCEPDVPPRKFFSGDAAPSQQQWPRYPNPLKMSES